MLKPLLQKLLLPIFTVLSLFGCAARMSYAPTSSYSEGDSRDINDEDILKAFQAEPQINFPVKIAWYNMSSDSLLYYIKSIDNKNVVENHLIPKTLIEGLEPLYGRPYYSSFYSAKPINFKEVRLLAARAKCDLVILVTSRFEENRTLNGWWFLNILILPALITPYSHVEYKYSSELFVFDVRNGYMYRNLG